MFSSSHKRWPLTKGKRSFKRAGRRLGRQKTFVLCLFAFFSVWVHPSAGGDESTPTCPTAVGRSWSPSNALELSSKASSKASLRAHVCWIKSVLHQQGAWENFISCWFYLCMYFGRDLISCLMSLPPGTRKTLSPVPFFTHSISNPALHCLVISRKNNNNNYVYHVDQSQKRKEQMSRVWRSNSNPASFHLCHSLLTLSRNSRLLAYFPPVKMTFLLSL